jgi:hypothetical protein
VKAIFGFLVAVLFAALFLGAGGTAVQGHVSLLIGAAGGLAIAVRALAASAS